MIIKCALCGLQERHCARGLSMRCWQHASRMGMLHAFPRLRQGTWSRREYDHARYLKRKAAANG